MDSFGGQQQNKCKSCRASMQPLCRRCVAESKANPSTINPKEPDPHDTKDGESKPSDDDLPRASASWKAQAQPAQKESDLRGPSATAQHQVLDEVVPGPSHTGASLPYWNDLNEWLADGRVKTASTASTQPDTPATTPLMSLNAQAMRFGVEAHPRPPPGQYQGIPAWQAVMDKVNEAKVKDAVTKLMESSGATCEGGHGFNRISGGYVCRDKQHYVSDAELHNVFMVGQLPHNCVIYVPSDAYPTSV